MAAKMMIVAETVTPTARAIELRAGATPSLGDAVAVDRDGDVAELEPGLAGQLSRG